MNFSKLFIYLLILNVSFFGVFFYFQKNPQSDIRYEIQEKREKSQYEFINPLLECGTSFNFFDTKNLEDSIQMYLNQNKNDYWDISYYFRFLNNWSTFWYNEKKEFIPASLIKIPLAIALFKYNEDSPWILDKKIYIDKLNFPVQKRDLWEDKVKIGFTYSIYELINYMLIDSDNIAAWLLLQYLWEDKVKMIYSELWLKNIDFNNSNSLEISSKDYSSFFRILYNSSYLSRDSSEKILSILSKSTFDIWIKATLPQDIIVSNKYWERLITDTWEKQLHDCGIVYFTKNPYLLCIMTKWNDFWKLSNIIQNISKTIFETVSK